MPGRPELQTSPSQPSEGGRGGLCIDWCIKESGAAGILAESPPSQRPALLVWVGMGENEGVEGVRASHI